MAMIVFPHCGEQVSEKAKKCVHCGAILIPEENCATDPSGSLQTYSSTFNDADTNTLNAYKAMELYLDD